MAENTRQPANRNSGYQPPGIPYWQYPLQNDNSSVVSSPPPINSDRQARPDTSLPSRKSKKPKTSRKTKGPNHIRQPKNSFICFRSKFVASSLANGENQQNELSKRAAELWRTMTKEEKQPFREEARMERGMYVAVMKNSNLEASSRNDISPEAAKEVERETLPFNPQPSLQNPVEQIAGPCHSLKSNGYAEMPELFLPDHPPTIRHQSFAGAGLQQSEGYGQYEDFQFDPLMGYMPPYPLSSPPSQETFMLSSMQRNSSWTLDDLFD